MAFTKVLKGFADQLEARQKQRKRERRILEEAMRAQVLSPAQREKLIKDLGRELELAQQRWNSAFRVWLSGFLGSLAVMVLLYFYFRHTWALVLAFIPCSISGALCGVRFVDAYAMGDVYAKAWEHLGVLSHAPAPSPPPRPNTENPPAMKSKFGLKQFIPYALICIPFVIAMFAIVAYVKSSVALLGLLLLLTLISALALDRLTSQKPREPIPLVSWICEFMVASHSVELAFQMPTECNTLAVQERIRVTTKAILRNFKEEGLQETLEQGLTKDVLELKIPVFRIQILAIDKVAVPEPAKVEEKKKDPSLYI